MNANSIMSVREVAAYLQLNYRSVYKLVRRAGLPGRKLLGRWRFHVRDVDAWLRDQPGERAHDGGAEDSKAASTERTR